jgi:hypothetical protein
MDFVSYDIAKKLKEKGFKTENTAWCYLDGNLVQVNKYVNISPYEYAPTISQVLKWLREEKKIHVEPCILADADIDADGKVINEYTYWSFSVTHIETGDMIYFEYERIDDKRFDSYEQAAIEGIEYVIDNLI